jgi:hypothetical protein
MGFTTLYPNSNLSPVSPSSELYNCEISLAAIVYIITVAFLLALKL